MAKLDKERKIVVQRVEKLNGPRMRFTECLRNSTKNWRSCTSKVSRSASGRAPQGEKPSREVLPPRNSPVSCEGPIQPQSGNARCVDLSNRIELRCWNCGRWSQQAVQSPSP